MADLRPAGWLLAATLAVAPAALAEDRSGPLAPEARAPAAPVAPTPVAEPPKAEAPHASTPAAPAGDHPAPAAAEPAAEGSDDPRRPHSIDEKRKPKPPVPPSLTGRALAEELRRSAGGRAGEKESLAAERARLEKLQKEITEARAALKAETEKLEALVKSAAGSSWAKGARPGQKPGQKGGPVDPVEGLSRTVKAMKPDQAASLLGRIDRSLAAALLERMKPAEAAGVLDRMDGATSAALVALIARKEAP